MAGSIGIIFKICFRILKYLEEDVYKRQGSSFSYVAAVVSATADVETDAANSSFTLFPV